MEMRKAYGPPHPVQLTCKKLSLTQQSFRDECNISTIMARFEKTGIVEHFNTHQGRYGDFGAVQDYQTSVNEVMKAREAFDSLPSKVRAAFENDPGKFLAFATDEKNEDEMIKLGLMKRPVKAEEAPPGNIKSEAQVREIVDKAIAEANGEPPRPRKKPDVGV